MDRKVFKESTPMKIVNFILKIKIAIVLLSLLFYIYPPTTFAASNFKTDYKVVYTINESGTTHADLSVVLTNTTKQFYASSYQMQLGFENISNIKASDEMGPINTTISKTTDGYNVSLAFNKKSVGLGSKLPFKLSFDTESVAKNSGKIWEINIPGIAKPQDFSTFLVDVKVPSSFGEATIIKPFKADKNLSFDKEELGKSGISIIFGNSQNFDFELMYHLRNKNVYPVKTEIALPPNTNYQEVFINEINPKPTSVTVDSDGNWLAHYNLASMQNKDIKVKGSVELSLNPKSTSLSKEEVSLYTSPTSFWQSNNSKIKKLAKELKTPEAIYNFVVITLKYDFRRVSDTTSRAGALNALNNPDSAVCREFTDLFIALSRGAGIPAREINGYAYTENQKQRPLSLKQDVLHAWPEYYNFEKKAWIMVDPTWGATTGGVDYFKVLDFDHIAFAIKGKDDSYPVPAGGYKFKDQKPNKDVSVTFGESSMNNSPKADIIITSSVQQIAGFPVSLDVKLINNGSSAFHPAPLYIFSKDLKPEKSAYQIPEVPPFSSITINKKFDKTSFWENRKSDVTIKFGEKSIVKKISIVPIFMTIWGIGGGVIVGILAISIFFIARRSRRI